MFAHDMTQTKVLVGFWKLMSKFVKIKIKSVLSQTEDQLELIDRCNDCTCEAYS